MLSRAFAQATLAILIAAAVSTTALAREEYRAFAQRGVPTAINWHFRVDEDCNYSLPSIELTSVPPDVLVWTEVRDYTIAAEDFVYGTPTCIGATIPAVFVMAKVSRDYPGNIAEVFYDRVMGDGVSPWLVIIELPVESSS